VLENLNLPNLEGLDKLVRTA